MSEFWNKVGRLLSRRTVATLVVVVLVTIGLGFGLKKLDFATGQDSYIDPSSQVAKDNKAGVDLLLEEREALAKLSETHSKDNEAWRRAVASFYGRFARRIVAAGIGDLPEAKAWCSERRDLVLQDGGLLQLSTDHPTYGYLEGSDVTG